MSELLGEILRQRRHRREQATLDRFGNFLFARKQEIAERIHNDTTLELIRFELPTEFVPFVNNCEQMTQFREWANIQNLSVTLCDNRVTLGPKINGG